MKPRGKKEVPQEKTEISSPIKKGTSRLYIGVGVQCEMGSEIFRRYWTPPNKGVAENESDQVITGDPIGADPLRFIGQGENISIAACSTENPVMGSGVPIDSNSCTNWTNSFSTHNIQIEDGLGGSSTPCGEAQGLVLPNNGSSGMVFPLVLNVVDESGSKEVVAVVSLDAMSQSDNAGNLLQQVHIQPQQMAESVVQQEVKPTKIYTCGDCRAILTDIVLYEKHCTEHDSSEPFRCTRCTRRFKRRQDLDRHIVSHPEEAFACGTCFMKFSDRDTLMSHFKTHEPVPNSSLPSEGPVQTATSCHVQTYQCSQCNKTFNDADLLQHHEFTHSEGELYPCDQCGRTFREESRLVMHLKLHKKNQKCDKCDEIFTNMFDFNEHMITHRYEESKGEYKCLQCKVSFNSFYFLKKHASSHGMDVHWCGDCGGSGHVGLTHSPNERPVLMMVKGDILPRQEEDPLKLEDNSEDGLTSANIEEQLEIEVQVDDVVIKNEHSGFSDDETAVVQVTNTKEETTKGKRKYSRKSKSLSEACGQRGGKSARKN